MSRGGCAPNTPALGLTAIMMSAPMARHAETGTGLVIPPSSSHLPFKFSGLIMPGMAIDALTASMIEPFCSQISRPVPRSLAIAVKGLAKLSMSASSLSVRRRLTICSPFHQAAARRVNIEEPRDFRPG